MPLNATNTKFATKLTPPPSIGPSSWKYILKLLGLMIVADGKVFKEKVDAYQDAMMELAVVIDPRLVMTRKMVFDWFVLNKTDLTDIIDSLEYDSVLIDIFKEIRNLPHKLDVVTAMVKIGVSDGEYSDKEKMFVKKTILYWNVRGGETFGAPVPHKRAANKPAYETT